MIEVTGLDLIIANPLFQVDYAAKAVENAGTAVALRGKDGVVFAVEKIVTSKL